MAPMLSPRQPPFGTRSRSARNSRNFTNADSTGAEVTSEPPPKKQKLVYKPGGPGGGGSYVVAVKNSEQKQRERGPRTSHTTSRSRSRRETTAKFPQTPTYTRPRRERPATMPRYSSAAAAAAAVAHGDGYKPREERGWEEFHQDLDIEAAIATFPSDEVDGLVQSSSSPLGPLNGTNNGDSVPKNDDITNGQNGQTGGAEASSLTPSKRRPGRPARRPDSMLSGILTPDAPKIIPPPGPNPRERLTLPKPSYRLQDPYVLYEQKGVGKQNYVDRTMASVGYQESDIFIRPEHRLIRMTEPTFEDDFESGVVFGGSETGASNTLGVGMVEYDMDEQDEKWLEAHNAWRLEHMVTEIKPAIFEIIMTKIEKEWHALEKRIPKPNPKPPQTHRPRSSSAAAVNGEPPAPGEEQDSKCAVCDDGDCENANAIVFCDGCDLAVHQECYGVPYIPEGQWLCRKCQLIGRGVPTCIFCPNTEGAFKQTNTSRWSHLLCAIWIPEVSLGNPSLMEPVNDVEKVPKSRWKLSCYICQQRMGACIQCSNKNCFTAFHVSCARRGGLYLKMKSGGTPATIDSNLLKAYCDKHTPSDWRREHNTEHATLEALHYYETTMRGRKWADSQASALALGPSQPIESIEEDPTMSHTTSGNKRNKGPPKTIWRLLSGAPVIPQSILNSVEASLQRFGINKKKEFAMEACKYWTLKREARRGAALLKRLQLQMETFSSMEMTRRDFNAMGAAGGVRLQRRIEFGHNRIQDIKSLGKITDQLLQREDTELEDTEILADIVDTVYCPISTLLLPIIDKSLSLDKKVFTKGLREIRHKIELRQYTSITAFSKEFTDVFSNGIGASSVENLTDLHLQIANRTASQELNAELKAKRSLAKRIIKAVQPMLEDAMKKESELNGKQFEKELKHLDFLLGSGALSRRDSMTGTSEHSSARGMPQSNGVNHIRPEDTMEIDAGAIPQDKDSTTNHLQDPRSAQSPTKPASITDDNAMDIDSAAADKQLHAEANFMPTSPRNTDGHNHTSETPPSMANAVESSKNVVKEIKGNEPPTPPMSFEGDAALPLFEGGVPWYMKTFDPDGTTIYEERWTGRDVVRGMSEELSDMDEDEVDELVDASELAEAGQEGSTPSLVNGTSEPPAKKKTKKRKHWRGFK